MHSNQPQQNRRSVANKLLQTLDIERLRKENHDSRKMIAQKLNQLFQMYKNFQKNTDIEKTKSMNTTACFSQDYISNFINELQKYDILIQSQIDFEGEEMKTINTESYKLRNDIKSLRIQNETLSKKNNSVNQSINDFKNKLSTLQNQYENLFQQSENLKHKIFEKENVQNSFKQIEKHWIQQNWQSQTAYITELIDERATLRKQFSLLQKAKILLQEKLIKYNQQLENSLQRKNDIKELKIQNQALLNRLNQQKQRRQNLEAKKLDLIIQKQTNIAGDIIQNWEESQRSSKNILQSIIDRVNTRLPQKKIENVEMIIREAENYFINKIQNQQQSNQHLMQQGLPQEKQYQI